MILRFILFALFGSGAFTGLGLLTRQLNWPTVVNSMTAIPLSPWILLIAMCGLLCGYSACAVRKRPSSLMNKSLSVVTGLTIAASLLACGEMAGGMSGGSMIFCFLTFIGLLFASMLASLCIPMDL